MSDNNLRWKELNREEVFSKYGRAVDQVVYRMPDGIEKDFYIKREKPAACILALTNDNKVLIVRQYRPGPDVILNEMPGGMIDPKDKNPAAAIKRELLEETGYKGSVTFVGKIFDDAYSSVERYCFVAKDCKKIAESTQDSEEFIEQRLLSLEEFRELLRSGRMTDVEVGYLCLDYLGLL